MRRSSSSRTTRWSASGSELASEASSTAKRSSFWQVHSCQDLELGDLLCLPRGVAAEFARQQGGHGRCSGDARSRVQKERTGSPAQHVAYTASRLVARGPDGLSSKIGQRRVEQPAPLLVLIAKRGDRGGI